MVQQKHALQRDDYHTLLRAFRTFDPEGTGWVSAETLRNLVCTRGEPFTEEEASCLLLSTAANEEGKVFYVSCMCAINACLRTGAPWGRQTCHLFLCALLQEDYAQKLATDGRAM
jgi:hypothetical protein